MRVIFQASPPQGLPVNQWFGGLRHRTELRVQAHSRGHVTPHSHCKHNSNTVNREAHSESMKWMIVVYGKRTATSNTQGGSIDTNLFNLPCNVKVVITNAE